jgi:hypothetical protein
MSGRILPGKLLPLVPALLVATLAACGDAQQTASPAASDAAVAPAAQPAATAAQPAAQPAVSATSPAVNTPPQSAQSKPGLDMSLRTNELLNPDDTSIVFLFQDLAGLTPQFDQWVEKDNRVRNGDPRERAALRETVKAELQAASAAVSDIGLLRLSLQSASLSKYDPTYGEFIIGALAPSSVIEYKAFDQKINLKFANGRNAQLWKVSPEEGQAIDDRVASSGNPKLEVLVQIKSVVPAPGGGSIMADVVEYELRDSRDDTTIGRVKVAQ